MIENIESIVSEKEVMSTITEGLGITEDQLRDIRHLERFAPIYVDGIAPPNLKIVRRNLRPGGRQMTFDSIEPSPFWDAIKKEMRELICGNDEKYADLRKELKGESGPLKTTSIGAISGVMGAYFGMAPTAIAAVVSMVLLIVLRVGREAFCSMQKGS